MNDSNNGMVDVFVPETGLPNQVFQDGGALGVLFADNAILTRRIYGPW